MPNRISEVTEPHFVSIVERARLPVLLYFYATWCGPCKAAEPVMGELAQLYQGQTEIVRIDIDQCPQLRMRFGITGVPTILLWKDGQIVGSAESWSRLHCATLLDRHVAMPPTLSESGPSLIPLRAFHGSEALKQRALKDAASRMSVFDPLPIRHPGASEFTRYQDDYGIPVSLVRHALCINQMLGSNRTLDWLEAIPAGADTQRVMPHLLRGILLDLVEFPLPYELAPPIRFETLIRSLAELHEKTVGLGGLTPPTAVDWREVRERASQTGEAMQDGTWRLLSRTAGTLSAPWHVVGDALCDGGFGGILLAFWNHGIRLALPDEHWARLEALEIAYRRRKESSSGLSAEALRETKEFRAMHEFRLSGKAQEDAVAGQLLAAFAQRWHRALLDALHAMLVNQNR